MRAHSVMLLGIACLASLCECADRRRLWNTMEEDRATVESWVEENRRQPQLPWRMKPKLEKYFNQQVTLPRRIKKPSPGKGPPGKRRPPSGSGAASSRPGLFSLIYDDLKHLLRTRTGWANESFTCFDRLVKRCRASHGEIDLLHVPHKDAPYYVSTEASGQALAESLQWSGPCA